MIGSQARTIQAQSHFGMMSLDVLVREKHLARWIPKDASELRDIFDDLLRGSIRALKEMVYVRRECLNYEHTFYHSTPALLVYANVALALLFRRWWILAGTWFIVMSQILWVAFKWIVYMVDDPQLHNMMRFCQGWTQRLIREGSTLLKRKDSMRLVLAGAVLYSCPTGVSYFRHMLRCEMRVINNRFVNQTLAERFTLARENNFVWRSLKSFNTRLATPRRSSQVGGS